MTRITPDALRTAAEWLDHNEGDGDESAHCHAVAEWLRREAERREIAAVARKHDVPMELAREAVRRTKRADR